MGQVEREEKTVCGRQKKGVVQCGNQQDSPSARGTGSDRLPREGKACRGAVYWSLGLKGCR